MWAIVQKTEFGWAKEKNVFDGQVHQWFLEHDGLNSTAEKQRE